MERKAPERITLTKIKYAAFASQETSCYEAIINLDGKPIATTRNDGHGGCDEVHPLTGCADRLAEAVAYCKTLPRWGVSEEDPEGYETDLESVCGAILDEYLTLRDMRRILKTKVLAVKPDRKLYEFGGKKWPVSTVLPVIAKKYPEAIILNSLTEPEALKLFKEGAA